MDLIGRFLARYARRNIPQYLLGACMLFATNWVVVRIPAIIGEALTRLESSGAAAVADARDLALELVLLGLLVVVVRTLSRVLFFNPGRDIEFRLMLDLFGHFLTLQRPYFARHKVGELVSIASNDTMAVRLLVGFAGLQLCNVAVAIPLHVYQMWVTDPVLTAWCTAPVVVGAVYMRWTVGRFFGMVRHGMTLLATLSDRVLECYAGIGTIRAHAVEEAAQARFEQQNREYLDLQLRISAVRAFGMPVLGFSGLVGTGIVLWVGGNRVVGGQMEVGDLATFTVLLTSLVSILMGLAWVLASISRGAVSLRRVDAVLQTDPGLPPVQAELAVERPPSLALRHLTFRHPDTHEPCLLDVDVTVPPGATLGVFGKTGSGKTTLVELLTRVHTPPPGTIFLDGVDVTEVDLGALRRCLAVVPQSAFLFSTSLAANITLEPDDATDRAKLQRVIEQAALSDDVAALPDGLATVVGERGVMLSGGQRQRAALARALYRSRPVLVLDDVLSAVDQGTEAKLVAAIRSVGTASGHGPTTVIVSHRTSVLEHCDEIIVLDAGQIVERGTHEALLAAGGHYAQTHAHQAEEGQP